MLVTPCKQSYQYRYTRTGLYRHYLPVYSYSQDMRKHTKRGMFISNYCHIGEDLANALALDSAVAAPAAARAPGSCSCVCSCSGSCSSSCSCCCSCFCPCSCSCSYIPPIQSRFYKVGMVSGHFKILYYKGGVESNGGRDYIRAYKRKYKYKFHHPCMHACTTAECNQVNLQTHVVPHPSCVIHRDGQKEQGCS